MEGALLTKVPIQVEVAAVEALREVRVAQEQRERTFKAAVGEAQQQHLMVYKLAVLVVLEDLRAAVGAVVPERVTVAPAVQVGQAAPVMQKSRLGRVSI
jgi:hypothetical protein